jgi:hypothetical protein
MTYPYPGSARLNKNTDKDFRLVLLVKLGYMRLNARLAKTALALNRSKSMNAKKVLSKCVS